MRLTCPRCGAQYEIAESAIPALGREVECSACGHVWHQPGQGKAAAPYDPAARPMLNRPLNESILSILREETARELQARSGDPSPGPDADDGADDGRDRADQNIANADNASVQAPSDQAPARVSGTVPGGHDWPATTLTEDTAAANRQPGSQPEPLAVSEPAMPRQTAPEPEQTELEPETAKAEPVLLTLPDAAELAATLTRSGPPPASTETQTPIEEQPIAAAPATAPDPQPAEVIALPAAEAKARRGSGYATGFGLAVMLALGVVMVYALAPRVSTGVAGNTLTEWRQEIDRGRLWLYDRVFGPDTTVE